MDYTERLLALKEFVYETVCKGKQFKTQGFNERGGADDYKVEYKEPEVFIGLYPRNKNRNSNERNDPSRVAPSVLIIPRLNYSGKFKEARFDNYEGINRSKEIAGVFSVQFLFCMYDTGKRNADTSITRKAEDIEDNTEQAVLNLIGWIEELSKQIMGLSQIPNTDLFVYKDSVCWSTLNSDDSVADHRPLYYGYLTVSFGHKTNKVNDKKIEELLG